MKRSAIDKEFFAVVDTLNTGVKTRMHVSLTPKDSLILTRAIQELLRVYRAANGEPLSMRVESFFSDIGDEWLNMLAGKKRR